MIIKSILLLISFGASIHYSHATEGSSTRGGADVVFCYDNRYHTSTLDAQFADIALAIGMIQPGYYNSYSLDVLRTGLSRYLTKYYPEMASAYAASFVSLHYKQINTELVSVQTGIFDSNSSWLIEFLKKHLDKNPGQTILTTDQCFKKQLAQQDFETHTVFVDEDLYKHLTQIEKVLLELHEAYLAKAHSDLRSVAESENDARVFVGTIYKDLKNFVDELDSPHLPIDRVSLNSVLGICSTVNSGNPGFTDYAQKFNTACFLGVLKSAGFDRCSLTSASDLNSSCSYEGAVNLAARCVP